MREKYFSIAGLSRTYEAVTPRNSTAAPLCSTFSSWMTCCDVFETLRDSGAHITSLACLMRTSDPIADPNSVQAIVKLRIVTLRLVTSISATAMNPVPVLPRVVIAVATIMNSMAATQRSKTRASHRFRQKKRCIGRWIASIRPIVTSSAFS